MRRIGLVAAMAALLAIAPFAASWAQTTDPSPDNVITIGGLLPMTGDVSSIGQDMRAAANLAVEDFNLYLSGLGVQWRLDIIIEDTETSPVKSLEKLQGLHARGVGVVVGPFASASVQNVKGYSDTNDLLILSPGSTSPALVIPDDSVFRMVPDDNNQGKVLGKLLEDRGIAAVVPIWRGEIYGDGLQRSAMENFESRGGFAHPGVRYNPDAAELSLEVSSLADAVQDMVERYGAERVAVLMVSFDEAVQIVQQSSSYDILDDVWWLGAESVAQQPPFVTDDIASEFAGTVDLTAVQIMISPGTAYQDVSSRLTDRLAAAPNVFAYPTYDSVWVLGKAILEAGADPADVKAILRDVAAAHRGTLSSNELNEAGDLALANYDVWKIVGGAWTAIGEYSAADDSLSSKPGAPAVDSGEITGEVTVGVLYPLTGRLSSKGAENLAGTNLGVADFNEYLRGIGAGWTMVVSVEDSETDPNAALEKTQALRARGVDIIIGPETSGSTTQVKPYADTNDMMLISCCSTSPGLAIPGDSVFRMVPDDSKQGVALGKLLESQGISAVVPVWRGDAYGDGLRDATESNFVSRGGVVNPGVRYNPDAVEFSGEVAALSDAVQDMVEQYGADRVAVLMISFDESVQIAQGASNYDILDDVRWFGSESLTKGTPLTDDRLAREFVNAAGFTSMQIAENRGEKYVRVQSHIYDTYGRDPTTFVYQAYDAAWLVGLSMLEAGSADAASVKAVFHKVAAGYSGALGSTTLNEAGDLAAADYAIWQISGDGWIETGRYSLLDDTISVGTMPAGAVMVDGTGFAPEYDVNGGKITAMYTNPQENTLIIGMDTTQNGNIIMTLPRALVDSRLSDAGDDDAFFVLVDGAEAEYQEIRSDGDSRTIQVDFPGGAEKIEIIGTSVAVPEFGVVAMLVLAAAVGFTVVAVSRSRLGAVPGM